AQARAELAAQRREQAAAASAERRERAAQRESESALEEQEPSQQALPPTPNLEVYRRLAEVQAPTALVDLVA
ncbi:MAG: putative metalloprotease CJM1_0395 family protein, partial [Pseudomonas sp.]